MIESTSNYKSLNHQVRFHYDLLTANRSPLKLQLSLRGVISDYFVKRLMSLGFLALILIGLYRGLSAAGKKVNTLRYCELASLALIALNLGVLLYQGTMYELETTLFFSIQCLFTVFVVTWIGCKLYLKGSQGLRRLSAMKAAKESVETNPNLDSQVPIDDLESTNIQNEDQMTVDQGDSL